MKIFRDWYATQRARWAAYWVPAERPEAQRSHREQIIDRLTKLQAQSNTKSAARQQRIGALNAAIVQAQSRVDELLVEFQNLKNEQLADSFRIGTEIDRLRAELASSCPHGLEKLLEQVNMEIEQAQRTSTMEPKIINRLTTLRRVREQAVTLRTAPIPMAETLTQLKRLEHDIMVA